jgi:hypothetical protein
MEEQSNGSIPSSSAQPVDHRLADEVLDEVDHRFVGEALEEDDISWNHLDKFLAAYVSLVIWGPVLVAALLTLILPLMKDDPGLNLLLALGYTAGGMLFAYLPAMVQLSRRQPLFFLYAVYYTLLIYVDCVASLLLLLLLPILLDVSLKAASTVGVTIYLLIPIAGWLLLVLVARRIILISHDYLFADTMPKDNSNGDDRLLAIFQRGIDENEFRYKYIPKTHLIVICNICIFCGIIIGSLVWKPSLAITLPVSFVCLVDICYSSCCRFEDEDPPDGPMQPPDGHIHPPDGTIQLADTTGQIRTQEEQGELV